MNTGDITFESIKTAMKECRALQPTDIPQMYVMTTEAFHLIRQELKEAESPATFSPLSILGTPVEHYATLREVHERCLELQKLGVNVAFVCK